jgi:hypothetical protein
VLALVTAALILLTSPRLGPLTAAELPALLREAHTDVLGAPPTRARLAMAVAQVRLEGIRLCGRNLGAIGAGPGEPSCRVGGSRLRAWESYGAAARGYFTLLQARCAGALHAMDGGDVDEVAGRLARCGYHRTTPERYAAGLRGFGP